MKLTRLAVSDLSHTQADLRRIFENSFPPHERDPFELIFDAATLGSVVVASITDRVVGFADVVDLGHDILFLRYLAVDSEYRLQGIGRCLLEYLVRMYSSSHERILFEVDHPKVASDAGIAVRRVRFYERWGAHEVRCIFDYFYPNPLNIRERIPIHLFERHLSEGPCLTGSALRAAIVLLYDRYYGSEAASLHIDELVSRVRC